MKPIRRILSIAVATAALTGWSGTTLSIRLVEASRAAANSSTGLEDVVDILTRNLPYASFTLQGSHTLSLPARQTVSIGGFTLLCTGAQHELQLAISRDGRTLISTLLRLQDHTPVIVGGFASPRGKQIFVLVSK